MYRVIKPRGGGKTTEILHLAEETGATVVCAHPHAMQGLAEARGISEKIRFISYYDFIFNERGRRDEYLIDEIDGLVKEISSSVIGYSLSPED